MASSAPLSKANTSFCLDLFKQLSDINKTANVFFSPFSISSALAMVMLGARGNTQTQMLEVLRLCEAKKLQPEEAQQQQLQQQQCLKTQDFQDNVHAYFNELLKALNKAEAKFSLSVANRLYGEQTLQFVEDFLEQTRKCYNAELESVDFKTNHEAARLKINGWVEKTTQGKIKNLLATGVVDRMTYLVLVNAIYFKSNWAKPFLIRDTKDAPFRVNKNETKPVKMMHQNDDFPLGWIDEISCQVLEMPYKGRELSMFIFLPKDIDDSSTGLEKLEKELTYEKFVEWTRPDRLTRSDVDVGLPRFKIEESYNMEKVLVSMGMVDSFDPIKCDFSGMSPSNNLVISKVVHKAFVDVNEEGTEAAAATGVVSTLYCALMSTGTFIADHPFLFFIRHNPSKSVLFAGRYSSPE